MWAGLVAAGLANRAAKLLGRIDKPECRSAGRRNHWDRHRVSAVWRSVVGVVWWCGNLEPVPGFACCDRGVFRRVLRVNARCNRLEKAGVPGIPGSETTGTGTEFPQCG